ncbi:hypothetical protein [Rhizobium leguminosarum]|uniref:hypothetical protein n=1 Tax=Rhizobium leguminosarum TaxID=384 RepID=UPI001C986DEC|nr:hypothetical protein [Rhizobium leguminosarum]MBY5696203.1 hypothetical protein [Rhizobium leguminosarum]
MLDKIGHVKNPLSVVAIFAGLAEVSGTLILPHLETSIQSVYVWFLMLFPTLLIALFFSTLNWNHTALYAPSDYRNEDHFARLAKASPDAIAAKTEAEVGEELAGDAVLEALPPARESYSSELAESVTPNLEPAPRRTSPQWVQERHRELAQRSRTVQQSAISKLETERGMLFAREIAAEGIPRMVFDAVSIHDNQTIIVEVKYTERGNLGSSNLHNTFTATLAFQQTMSDARRQKLHFILVVVISDEATNADRERLLTIANRVRSEYSFSSEVVVWRYGEVVNIFD